MLRDMVAMFLKVTTIVSPSSALSVGPSRPAGEKKHAHVAPAARMYVFIRCDATSAGQVMTFHTNSLTSYVITVDSLTVIDHKI